MVCPDRRVLRKGQIALVAGVVGIEGWIMRDVFAVTLVIINRLVLLN
jgi:hypothetical protein